MTRPRDEDVRAFLAREKDCPHSYPEVGATRGAPPPGYAVDHNRIPLGRGEATFQQACQALRCWRMFPAPWTEILPRAAPIQAGTTVAVLFHLFGSWWLNACRIVYVIDEEKPIRRFGFAYGTLLEHVERGEERFSVELSATGEVVYDLLAFSRPRLWLARLGYPLARRQQRRFVRDSQASLRRALAEGAAAMADDDRR